MYNIPSGIEVLPIEVSYGDFKNFCYLIFEDGSRDGVLVDPAWQKGKIMAEVEKLQINLKAVLITHAHPDHTHLAKEMSNEYHVPIVISDTDLPFAQFSKQANLQVVKEEGILIFGKLHCTVIFTPGHTMGSICYQVGDNLFSGDTLFTEGCGMCFGDRSDPAKLFYSLRRLKELLPLHFRVYPGHKYHYDIGNTMSYLMKNNIYLQFDNIDHFIQFRMRKKQNTLFQFL